MATTTNFGWETPDDTDLVKDGAAAIRTLGQSIDTSMMDLEGGTTGQVLSKASNTDMDFTWVTSDDANAIQNSIVDAKGDLIAATAADTPARLAVGTNGHVLTADSTAATGIKWAAAAASGKVNQVVTATTATETSTTSTTYADVTNLTVTITPSAASSRILISVSSPCLAYRSGDGTTAAALQIVRGSTSIADFGRVAGAYAIGEHSAYALAGLTYVDSPSTTSATTYKVQVKTVTGATAYVNRTGEQPLSTITVTEILA
jgi:hypothetical protein